MDGRNKIPTDITGKRFGKLIAVRFVGRNKYYTPMWECKCDCGNTKIVSYANLKKGLTNSCGCLRYEEHGPNEDLTGMRYGRLVVMEFVGHTKPDSSQLWRCKCDCGNVIVTRKTALISGATQSCGCYNRDMHADIGKRIRPPKPVHTKYGDFTTSDFIFKEYIRMVYRGSAELEYYPDYRAKGIGIDRRWYDPARVAPDAGIYRDIVGITTFIEDMYDECINHIKKYGKKNTTLDRIDGNKDYSVENCRWATYVIQNNNLSTTRHITDDGVTVLSFSECVRKYIDDTVSISNTEQRIPASIIQQRISRGWSVNEILCALKHAKEYGRLIEHAKIRERFMIRVIDQSIVYDMYPDEKRFPGYEDYIPKQP